MTGRCDGCVLFSSGFCCRKYIPFQYIYGNCGAYLFEWRPIDCGNGNYFAILVGGNTITESNVILNRGYDYAYTFDPMTYARPWGTVPDLVNTDGVWAIPENWGSLPEGTQPVLQIILKTNNKNLDTDKRYINIVHLPTALTPLLSRRRYANTSSM